MIVKGRNVIVALAVAMALIIVTQPVAVGYASSTYSSVTINSGNTAVADYFTVGIYQKTDYDFDNPTTVETFSQSYEPASSVISDSVEVLYSSSGNRYVINSGYTLTVENCFIAILNSENTVKQYSVSIDCNLDTSAEAVYGSSVTFEYKLGNDQAYKSTSVPTTVNSGTAYCISIRMTVNYNNTTVPVDIPLSVMLTSVDTTHGVYFGAHTIEVGSTTANTAISDIMAENGLNTPSISYGGQTYNLVDPDPTHSTYGPNTSAVRFSNSSNGDGGIVSNKNDKINLRLEVPSNKYFVIAIHYYDHNKTQKLSVKVVGDSETLFDSTLSLSGTGEKYICRQSDYQAVAKDSMPSSNSEWLNIWGDITVEISASQGNSHIAEDTTFDIVFKQT